MKMRKTGLIITIIGLAMIYAGFIVRQQEQKKHVAHLIDIVAEQKLRMRVLAYHQAIAQLEQQFPLGFRDRFDPVDWEQMVLDKTEMILAAFPVAE